MSVKEEMEAKPADEQLAGGMSDIKVVNQSENAELT